MYLISKCTSPVKTDNEKKYLWIWYNKLDTKIRANERKMVQFMKRAVYDK